MKESIYSWMKNLAVFYIFLTAVMNFIPEKKYEKYFRHFMGLLLILLILSPVFELFQMRDVMDQNFWNSYRKEEMEGLRRQGEEIQENYLKEKYEEELEKTIQNRLESMGKPPEELQIKLARGQELVVEQAVILYENRLEEKEKEEITHVLKEDYGIEEAKIQLEYREDNQTAVDSSSFSGTDSGYHRTSRD